MRAASTGSLFVDHLDVVHDETTSYDVEAVTLGALLKRLGVASAAILKLDIEGAETISWTARPSAELRPFKQLFIEFRYHAVSHFNVADTRRLVARISGFGFPSFSVADHNYLFCRAR